jgi:serine/threonine protein kinase
MKTYIGETINGYVLVEKLGEGGFGVVYKVEDFKTHEKFILKIDICLFFSKIKCVFKLCIKND